MNRLKIMSIFGTRPEAIKMIPIINKLKSESDIDNIVCVTAQHREMLDQVMNLYGVIADYDLDIMSPNQSLCKLTENLLCKLDEILKIENPDMVLVHGDTTTTMVASLAAYYNHIKVAHVEAGLRTYNKYEPYPEEINRQITGVIADIHFAPTNKAKENLLLENKSKETIFVTGNTVIDALKMTIVSNYWHEYFDWVGKERLILMTVHRRENLGEPIRNIFNAVKRIADERDDVKFIYPVHLNPKIRKVAEDCIGHHNKVKIIEPLGVKDFHNFMNKSYLILTDSGGIQEEASSIGKPVLVLRDFTERQEGIEAGNLKLIGTKEDVVYYEIKKLLDDDFGYKDMTRKCNLYGNGNAAANIVYHLKKYLYGN